MDWLNNSLPVPVSPYINTEASDLQAFLDLAIASLIKLLSLKYHQIHNPFLSTTNFID